jgi:hypothetical protein
MALTEAQERFYEAHKDKCSIKDGVLQYLRRRVCEHGRQEHQCKECGEWFLCEHGIRRYTCKQCGGTGICEHGKHMHLCPKCRPLSVIRAYKHCARKRDLSWELTDAQAIWLMQQPCAYCGQEGSGGVDRAKNEYGYTILNSVPCCNACNMSKRVATVKAFIVAVNQIARYCPSYPAFKERWDTIRKKLTQLGEQQDAAVSVPMHRVSRSNRKTPDLRGVPETPVVHMRGSVGSDAGSARVV